MSMNTFTMAPTTLQSRKRSPKKTRSASQRRWNEPSLTFRTWLVRKNLIPSLGGTKSPALWTDWEQSRDQFFNGSSRTAGSAVSYGYAETRANIHPTTYVLTVPLGARDGIDSR